MHILRYSIKSLLAACALSFLFAGAAFAKPAPNIILNEDEILQVVFYYAADPSIAQTDASLASSMEREAQEEFKEALEALLKEVELPVAVEFVGRGKRPEKTLPVLKIQSIRWGRGSGTEIEAVISAKLESEDKTKNKLGSFSAREPSLNQHFEALQKKTRINVMTAALVELLGELNKHFPSPQDAATAGEGSDAGAN